MKYLLFSLGLLVVGCVPTFQMRPDSTITQNLHLFSFYPEYGTDYEVESIAHHYMTQENDTDAFGHILADFDNVEVSVFVYIGADGLYWYKMNPKTGEECKVYLTQEQRNHVWSFN